MNTIIEYPDDVTYTDQLGQFHQITVSLTPRNLVIANNGRIDEIDVQDYINFVNRLKHSEQNHNIHNLKCNNIKRITYIENEYRFVN